MNNLDWQSNDDKADLANRDQYSLDQLKAMQLVARMKEAADKAGAGFVGGFISPTGQRFMMSNVDENDVQFQSISEELSAIQKKRAANEMEESFFDNFQNNNKFLDSLKNLGLHVKPEEE